MATSSSFCVYQKHVPCCLCSCILSNLVCQENCLRLLRKSIDLSRCLSLRELHPQSSVEARTTTLRNTVDLYRSLLLVCIPRSEQLLEWELLACNHLVRCACLCACWSFVTSSWPVARKTKQNSPAYRNILYCLHNSALIPALELSLRQSRELSTTFIFSASQLNPRLLDSCYDTPKFPEKC